MMRKGISPVVATVLLIAIAVITSVGLYYWLGTFQTKPTTSEKPSEIQLQSTGCNETTDVLTAVVMNLGTKSVNITSLMMSGKESSVAVTNVSSSDTLLGGQSGTLMFNDTTGTGFVRGDTYTIYGTGVTTAQVVC